MDGLEGILSGMDGQQNQPAEPAAQGQQGQTPPEGTPPAQGQQQQQQQQEEEFNPEELFGGGKGKQNAAFAKMRTENTRMNTTMQRLGQLLNIPNYMDENALLDGLQQQMLELQSKQSNIPLNYLQEHEEMAQKLSTFERGQLAAQTELGFQKVKDSYGLKPSELKAFATKLFEEGKNPYTQPINLLNEYRMMFFDDILAKSNAAAAEAALKLDQKAADKSTKPNSATGTGGGPQQGIQNMADLDNLLASLDKK